MPWSRTRPVNPKYRTPEHLTGRAALIAAFTPGQPCCLCGHPMWTTRYLEADHIPGTNQHRGLAHGTRHRCTTCRRACNQRDGAKRGNAQRRTTAQRM
jgi:hypothetical protein